MKRKSSVPKHICEILEDLETLTDRKASEYEISVDDETYDADPEILSQVISLTPADYKNDKDKEKELNEYRHRAGMSVKKLYEEDEYIKNLKAIARI